MARAGIFYFDSAQGKRVFRLLADSEKNSRKERACKKQALTKKPLSAKKPAPAKMMAVAASNKMPVCNKMTASNKMPAPAKMPASMETKASADWKTTRLAAMTKTHRGRALQKINRRWKLDVYKSFKNKPTRQPFRVRFARMAEQCLFDEEKSPLQVKNDSKKEQRCKEKLLRKQQKQSAKGRGNAAILLQSRLDGALPMNEKYFASSLSKEQYKYWLEKQDLESNEIAHKQMLVQNNGQFQEWRAFAIEVFRRINTY